MREVTFDLIWSGIIPKNRSILYLNVEWILYNNINFDAIQVPSLVVSEPIQKIL